MVLTWRQSTDEASRLHVKQEDEEGERERREERKKKRSLPRDETLHVATYLRSPRAAASPASFRDEIVSGIYLS